MSDKKPTVFIAEDDDLILMVLEDMLDELGCVVAGSAATVADAVSFIAQNSVDLAIVDVKLRDGSVEPLADELVKREIPFVLATGFASPALIARYPDQPVLHKPYLMDDVRAAIDALQSRQSATKAIA